MPRFRRSPAPRAPIPSAFPGLSIQTGVAAEVLKPGGTGAGADIPRATANLARGRN